MAPTKTRIAAGLAAAAGAAALTLTGTGAAQAYPSGDPLSSGCANGSTQTISRAVVGGATIEVRYSPTCGTNWVRVSNVGGRASEAGINSPYSGWQWSRSYAQSPNSYWTNQVYAPGNTCILWQARVVPPGGITAQSGSARVC
ncbi:DUF2690 domain-containing protein [Skermania sp. ID1734]|uniref:DUF2690 domain-containing protein n=1 Tax=Skermania sp. ID1734 TaxID=2597516 RepID=UPI00117D2662|nr:DUF2690 domain-containing protein [Skermania sp. ID1734]TSD93045.1 DUF2690 domain-containing protein [Skermania sp. ID1734]